ncbi:hypothetical protein HMPREF1030_04926 [Pseudomonas aeruginosa]|nr:hypothetical protein HMPREF1030_04926 [Pseudomonas aeruginosa]
MRGCRRHVPAADWVAVKKRLDPAKRKVALKLYHERQYIVVEICRMMGIGRSTLYNYITEAERDARQQA